MSFHFRNIKKYRRWIRRTSEAYEKNCNISKDYARICRKLDFALLLKLSPDKIDCLSMKKHEWILNYMREKCPLTLEAYKNINTPDNINQPNQDIKIWSMWWQGEENAGPLFKMCINSARVHTGYPVITLSKDNYRDYFEIPEYVLEKHRTGKIALQHICDLMVVSILAAEGGVFTGATVWWSQDVGEEFLRSPFFVCKAVSQNKYLVSRSRWVGYFLAGNKEFPLFSFVRDCLQEYWKNCDQAVDYLMMDYLFELAYQTIPCVKEMIDSVPDNNLLRNELINDLSTSYDEKKFSKYTKGKTFLYKLSWKFGSKAVVSHDGKLTNYGHMLQEAGLNF